MQVWSVPPRAVAHAARPAMLDAPDAVAARIACTARPDFATRALAELNRVLAVAWWTVYRVFDDQPPRLCAQASHAVPDITLDCWRIYRGGVYRDDTHFARGRELVVDPAAGNLAAVMTHCLAADFGPAHREQSYAVHSLSERLSIVSHDRGPADAPGAGALLAVNLYRHHGQPRFDAAAFDSVLGMAGALMSVVR